MKLNATRLARAVLIVAFAVATPAFAQSTTASDVLNFEVIAVDGDTLVIRDQNGTRELVVPKDFQFKVDGKNMSTTDLKPGMKGTATVTTTTTVRPVFVTEVREAQVMRASDLSVTVRDADGTSRRYSQGELDKKGVEVFKDGKAVRLYDLKRGDKLTATLVTSGPPVVLTEKEVQASLAEPDAPAPASTQVASAGTGTPVAAAASSTPPAPSAAPASDPAMAAATVAPAAPEASGSRTMWYVAFAILIVLAVFLFMRRRERT